AATPFRPATVVTDDAGIEASVAVPPRVLVSILVPAAGRVVVPVRNPNPNEPGVNDPAAGVLVTVASVPTPYSDFSTVPWAFLTPVAAAVTVMTRPMPKARPRAMNAACGMRRLSSV